MSSVIVIWFNKNIIFIAFLSHIILLFIFIYSVQKHKNQIPVRKINFSLWFIFLWYFSICSFSSYIYFFLFYLVFPIFFIKVFIAFPAIFLDNNLVFIWTINESIIWILNYLFFDLISYMGNWDFSYILEINTT